MSLTKERKGSGRAPKQPAAWFDEQLALAEEDRKEGRIREALVRILKAEEQDPGEEHLGEFNRLLGELNRDVLEMDSLVGWFIAERDPIVFGEPVRVRIRLHNPTRRHIRIAKQLEPVTPEQHHVGTLAGPRGDPNPPVADHAATLPAARDQQPTVELRHIAHQSLRTPALEHVITRPLAQLTATLGVRQEFDERAADRLGVAPIRE